MSADIDATLGALVRRQFPAVCLIVDTDGRVVEANAHSCSLLGPDVLGARFGELLVTFERDVSPAAICAAGPASRQVSFVTRQGLPNSYDCWFAACGEHVVIVGGAKPEEQEGLRRELFSLTQDLGVRTRDLQKSNVALDRLVARKNQFLGMAAHDLRSPLLGVTLSGSMLRQELAPCLDEGQAAAFDELLASAEHMRRVIDAFLDLAQSEAGHLRIRPALGSLEAVAEEAAALVRRIHPGGAEIRVTGASVPRSCVFDASKMRQVFINLLNNAVQHSQPGDIVDVALDVTAQHATVSVRDSGAGIPPEIRDEVFRPFVRRGAGAGDEGPHRRLGLGLAIAKLIVEAHHGHITLESAPGHGTTVVVRLPLADEAPMVVD